MMLLLLTLFLSACGLAGARSPAPDAGIGRDPTLCQRKEDLGHEVWWIFSPEHGISILQNGPLLTRHGYVGSRYVCKDHGKERHGLWWEQIPPDDRELP